MHSRRALRTSRRRRASHGPMRRLGLIAAGTCVPVLFIGYAVMAAHGERAVDTASVWSPGAGAGASGWGRGGQSMMPGPAGPAPSWSSAPSPQEQRAAPNAAAMTSQNWAGYAAAGNPGTFTSVSASWTEPAVTCTAASTFASFWAGLDGDGTTTVEQTGTEADCAAGATSYQGWFEMFPASPVFYDNPVMPGDAISASVVAHGGGAFTLTLKDSTQGWTRTTNQTSGTAQLGSAEVITEAPSDQTVLPLSNFGTVNFTDATADDSAIGNENPSALTMVSADDVTEAAPSALTGGNAFAVTWDSSGTTVPAAPAPGASAPAPGTGIRRAGTTTTGPVADHGERTAWDLPLSGTAVHPASPARRPR
jgi:Peptidase A4 family